ncbi:helix-turn-helix domain-containing protein [Lactococcus insecticola]|uniref:HTH cro/C1-type domain-containing protein n=1 Tax=Pseudolactococcus insecticola TaxID=2709158 RepID=A0A6A0B8R6_9LACT|nr:helix-turn-helix transcriptional regulator [Lactococcus insecticola]GFH40831.1 hypothetical protein Hs20B_12290 [Lactococcus insecticola]
MSDVIIISDMDLRSIRKKLHMSQSEFAKEVGISVTTIENVEKGYWLFSPKMKAKVIIYLKVNRFNQETLTRVEENVERKQKALAENIQRLYDNFVFSVGMYQQAPNYARAAYHSTLKQYDALGVDSRERTYLQMNRQTFVEKLDQFLLVNI